MPRRNPSQPDLFGDSRDPVDDFEPDEAFMEIVHRDLDALMTKARDAEKFPWKDFTQSTLAEMRFEGLLKWLPPEEATRMHDAFAAELDRLYALCEADGTKG